MSALTKLAGIGAMLYCLAGTPAYADPNVSGNHNPRIYAQLEVNQEVETAVDKERKCMQGKALITAGMTGLLGFAIGLYAGTRRRQ